MCAHVREETGLSEGFPLADVADMHFYHRHSALFHGIPQRYARMTIPARIEHDSVVRALALALAVSLLYPINQVSLVVGLLIDKMHLRPDSLDI